nr:hypothetical protein [Tanacetum cinerariifolium]
MSMGRSDPYKWRRAGPIRDEGTVGLECSFQWHAREILTTWGTVEASESFRGKLVKTLWEETSCCRTSCIYQGEEDQSFSIRSSSESKMACTNGV